MFAMEKAHSEEDTVYDVFSLSSSYFDNTSI
jgi:hypothetical protein